MFYFVLYIIIKWLTFINTQDKNILTLAQFGKKVMRFGEIATAMKGIVETGLYLKNTLAPVVAGVAALAI
jgi:hypothetical protein